ncbi:XdhC family protein [Sinomonas notoginsengisoli]|uniref:XdhC family protein n=1 Tax=Sinomonas notoginsengisoli TaxID=1457311 RepID=UPI001F208605|nr:XdhC family protein [Sinomonas notoginsengisoli]
MREVIEQCDSWFRQGEPFALATVVRTWQSSPRPAGAAMAVSATGEVVGSVSGGCVEGAVYELARQVLDTGEPATETYGVQDDSAFAVGLTCGGTIEVFVELIDPRTFPEFPRLASAIKAREPVSTATVVGCDARAGRHLVVNGRSALGSLGPERLNAAVSVQARGFLKSGRTGAIRLGRDGESRNEDLTVFVASFAPPPRMLVFGAIDFAGAMVRIGKFLGYDVTLCDARPVFATSSRFPEADEVIVAWPHEYLSSTPVDARTAICVLTHDPKFDIPLLRTALRTEAAYIGAMGSRRTHEDRMARLRELGTSETDLRRLSSPIGLDLGACTPEETAVSIAAEIIACTWGGTGQRLSSLSAPIHRRRGGDSPVPRPAVPAGHLMRSEP